MTSTSLPVDLTEAQIEELCRELDAIRDEVFDSRGERDRQYILKLIRTQRSLALGGRVVIYAALFLHPAWNHALAGWWSCLGVLVVGIAMLAVSFVMLLAINLVQAWAARRS